MQIDCYGFDAVSGDFKRKALEVHLLKTIGNATYLCFSDEPVRCIHRILTEADGVSLSWARGAWDAAETLNYIPINETREV